MIILVHLLQLVWQMLFRIYSAYYLFRFVISSNVLYILCNDPTAPLNHQGRLRIRIRYTLCLRSRCHLQSLIHKQALLFYFAKKYSRIRQSAKSQKCVGQLDRKPAWRVCRKFAFLGVFHSQLSQAQGGANST